MSKNYSIYLYNCYFFKENYKHINGFGMTIRYLPFFKACLKKYSNFETMFTGNIC